MAVPYVHFITLDSGKDIYTYDTYGLILSKQEIGLPSVKTKFIDIEGRNGSIDMTDAFDEVFYGDRTLTFTFNIVSDIYAWDELKTRIASDLHGRRCRITIYSDSDIHYVGQVPFDLSDFYIGRCMIDKYQSSKGLGTIVIKCICEPFKYGWEKNKDITLGTTEITTVTETFKVDGLPMDIYFNTVDAESSYTTFKIDDGPEFALPKKSYGYYPIAIGNGQHTIQITGQGSASMTYQEKYI